jgi:polyisoprenoid-binding protein YceI
VTRETTVTATIERHALLPISLPNPAGRWQAVVEQSHAAFVARVAGRPVRGRLPVFGEASIAGPAEQWGTRLVASTARLSTSSPVLDRILKGPGFLEAEDFPEIDFRSQTLVRVPTGWRAIGHLRVKGIEHELACELALGRLPRDLAGVPRITAISHWALDSTWITGQRIPGLSRRVSMTSSVVLEPAR